MSKNLDSDLYGDIYGDDYNDPSSPPADTTAEVALPVPVPAPTASSTANSSKTDAHSSLPAKPSPSSSASLSYSAQIAQQFSAYQQSPSQERQSHQQQHQQQRVQQPQSMSQPPPAPIAVVPISSDTVFGKKPSEMHDEGKLFIGGLSWDTTDEGLKNYFSEFGKVDACTIMRDPSGTSRGFAFLTFEDANAVNAVVSRDHTLDGKMIDPKRAIPREEHLRNTRYFVGGLSPNTTGDSMREFFRAYGKVVDATVMVDRETGRSKGFGFVTFEDANNTDQLVGKHLVMDEKQIEVKAAQPRSQREQARNGNGGREDNDSQQMQGGMPDIPFIPQQLPMLYNRGMTPALSMMSGGMPAMMGMNPMMAMNGFNPMMMNGMGLMGGHAMNAMQQMRMGMMAPGWGNMMGTGMMARPPMDNTGMAAGNAGRPGATNASVGPARTARAQHNFHPYSR